MVERGARLEAVDTVALRLSSIVHRAFKHRSIKNLLTGTWLGHPLHPVFSDLPIGCWSCAAGLDLAGRDGAHEVADVLVLLGIVSAVPAGVTGLADWSDTEGEDRRIGLVHATANLLAVSLYSTSLIVDRRRHPWFSLGLRLAGLGGVTAGGYLGGHLTFGRGVGVDHTLFDEAPTYWTRIAGESDLREGRLLRGTADHYDILLYKKDGHVYALADRCTHAGGPLHEGQVDADLCVVCPWHGSRFRLVDGSVARGPATAPQPVFDVRIADDHVEIRRR
jgi:nitrite reductase/ring-hydroxylating ferredoxin subunit/uncharacterized membrane protein